MEDIAFGLLQAIQPENLFYSIVGVTIGMVVGMLPGIGPMASISILLPVTFYMEPTQAIMMLAGIYYGAAYGGSVAAILLNIPGDATAAVTCLEGYPMAKAGRAGVALFMTTVASWVAAMFGVTLLIFSSPYIADLAMSFGPAEYLAVMMLGLIAACTISSASPIKSVTMVVFGALLGTVGVDVNTGTSRFTFGVFQLLDGVNIVVLAMGLFGVAEVINGFLQKRSAEVDKQRVTLRSMMPTRSDIKISVFPIMRGSTVGSFFGALPGTGGTVATFVSYALEKRLGKGPVPFGQGALQGLVSPEAANNAAVQTSFIPSLTLGIPGDAVMALMLGALIIHGIVPGPGLISSHPELFWGLIGSFIVGNLVLLVLNIPLIGIWVKVLKVPSYILYPSVICLVCIGVYSLNKSYVDLMMTGLFGVIGYFLMKAKYEVGMILLGFVLAPMIETSFRRALLLSGGDISIIFSSTISVTLLSISAVLLALPVIGMILRMDVMKKKHPNV